MEETFKERYLRIQATASKPTQSIKKSNVAESKKRTKRSVTLSPGPSPDLRLQALSPGLGLGLRIRKPKPAQARPRPGLTGQAGPVDSLLPSTALRPYVVTVRLPRPSSVYVM
ncbi:hypothetical protein C8R45DRAFT_922830 [Mycena sanguinolenta]|nr:hypothetical protein C8R45DRAFT_922830 [Mycena sanguinolenta]